MNAPWLQTGSGRAFDLLDPKPEAVDFAVDIAEALARIPRFTGHIRSGPYSVAQHCVVGADAIFRETSRPDLATYFLLHDAHEAYCGDIATPIAQALMDIAGGSYGIDGRAAVRFSIKSLKSRLDYAIHTAAGVVFPVPDEVQWAVKNWDLRMLMTERNQLLGICARPWSADQEAVQPIKLTGALKVWPWARAADEYRAALRRWCPAAIPDLV